MITLSNGHQFEFMAASGALKFDGHGWPWEQPFRWVGLIDPTLFTIVIKTLTRQPRKGNLRMYKPWGCVRLLPGGGAVNSVGLTNPGIDWWCRSVGPRVSAFAKASADRQGLGYSLVGSIIADSTQEWVEMAQMLNPFALKALELNLSCPNTTDHKVLSEHSDKLAEMVRAVKAVSKFPLIAKLSVVHPYQELVGKLEGLVEAVSINTIPWTRIYPDKVSPIAHLGGGGVSGKLAQPMLWTMAREMALASTIPVIGSSVWEYEDVQKVFDLGCKAVSFGSVFMPYPWRPTQFVRRWKREHA